MALEDELTGFHGTTRYYVHPLGLRFTDGILYLAERAQSYWLIDLVSSYQPDAGDAWFQLWHVAVRDDASALVTMREDSGQPLRIRQEIAYTDFPIPDFSWYVVDQVMMLRSEY